MHKIVSDYTTNDNGSSNIKVFVRARPPEDSNSKTDFIDAYSDDGKKLTIRDPEPSNKKYSEVVFQFDRVFWIDSQQDEIFNAVCKPQVDNVLSGYNGCCFAYGQTGSGKTYSMFGESGDNRGVIPRSSEYLFERIAQKTSNSNEIAVFCSFLEIYNDQLRDLGKAYLVTTGIESNPSSSFLEKTSDLFDIIEKKRQNPYFSKAFNRSTTARALASEEITPELKVVQEEYNSMNYEIREDSLGNVFVKDLSLIPINTVDEVMSVITLGLKLRAVADTKMNAVSSRSHTVFTITVVQREANAMEAVTGVLNLVDLAGSERLKKSDSQGTRLREALHINTSLTALGKVVVALDSTSEATHIPYRDSKLTRMLQNSLGGNSFTTVLAAIHPSPNYYEECLSTLQFANRCRNVRNHPRVNYIGDSAEDKERKIRRLLDEVSTLRVKLIQMENGSSFPMSKIVALLTKVGVQATSTAEGGIVLGDGRVLSSDQLGIAPAVAADASVASVTSTQIDVDTSPSRRSSFLRPKISRAASILMNQNGTANEARMKKVIVDLQNDVELYKIKLKEKKNTIDSLNQHVRELTAEHIRTSTSAKHTENELMRKIADSDRLLKEALATTKNQHTVEINKLVQNNQELQQDSHRMLNSVPTNLKAFTKAFKDHERNYSAIEISLQEKMDRKMELFEQSRQVELENMKAQYDLWLQQKDNALKELSEGFKKYREKKSGQLKKCELEIIKLYEYTQKIEVILRNAENGVYSVTQRNANAELPTTGLFNYTETGAGNMTGQSTGPLRLGGILLPKGVKPTNPLCEGDEPLGLTKRIIKKHEETLRRLRIMKEEAFNKSIGKTPTALGVGVSSSSVALDPMLSQKIQSMFLPAEKQRPQSSKELNRSSGRIGSSTPTMTTRAGSERMEDVNDRAPKLTTGTSQDMMSLNIRSQSAKFPRETNMSNKDRASSTSRSGGVVANKLATLDIDVDQGGDNTEEGLIDEVLQLREEVARLREMEADKQLSLNAIMEELENNETAQYIKHLEAVQDRLQKQLKESNAQLQSVKVVNSSLIRSVNKGAADTKILSKS